MPTEINSNDFGRFGNYLADSHSNFVVVEIFSSNQFDFLCVRGSNTYKVTVHVHVLWPVCTHHTFFPTVIVSLMIHDNIRVVFFFFGRTRQMVN